MVLVVVGSILCTKTQFQKFSISLAKYFTKVQTKEPFLRSHIWQISIQDSCTFEGQQKTSVIGTHICFRNLLDYQHLAKTNPFLCTIISYNFMLQYTNVDLQRIFFLSLLSFNLFFKRKYEKCKCVFNYVWTRFFPTFYGIPHMHAGDVLSPKKPHYHYSLF